MDSKILLPLPNDLLSGGHLLAAWHDHVPGYQFAAGEFARSRSAPPGPLSRAVAIR